MMPTEGPGAEGEPAEGAGSVDAAAMMEEACRPGLLLSGVVALTMGPVLFMSPPVWLVSSYSVGGWTRAYRAILVSLHL